MTRLRPALLLGLLALLALAAPATAAGPQPRVIPGDPVAENGDFPWTVALVTPDNPRRAFCGGTLIAENLVLTAAHCTIGYPASTTQVIVGARDFSPAGTANLAPHRFAVARVSLHPQANAAPESASLRRDLSLLTLADNAGGSTAAVATAAPVGLGDEADLAPGSPLTVTGWGITATSGGDTVRNMRVGAVEAIADDACEDAYDALLGDGIFDPADQVCAIGDDNGTVVDTCNGDSGGPMVAPQTADPADADPKVPGDWRLVGVTSWGYDCAYVDEEGNVVPGVYARPTSPQLSGYVAQALDVDGDNAPVQPEWTPPDADNDAVPDETVDIAADDTGVACAGNPLTWSGGVDQVDYLIRRVLDDGGLETVSTLGFYLFDEGDAEDAFLCEVRGRNANAGGWGVAQSTPVPGPDAKVVDPVIIDRPVDRPVPVPGPTVTVTQPVPVPVPFPVPDARDADQTAPRVSRVRRSCTKRRVCRFTITATDAGAGVRTVSAQINTVRSRRCTVRGRRTTCGSLRTASMTARAVRGRPGTFRVVTGRLTRGSHALQVRAIDRAGNVQLSPRLVSFRLR